MLTDFQSSSNIHFAKQKAGQEHPLVCRSRKVLLQCLGRVRDLSQGSSEAPEVAMVVEVGSRQPGFCAAVQMFSLTFLIYLLICLIYVCTCIFVQMCVCGCAHATVCMRKSEESFQNSIFFFYVWGSGNELKSSGIIADFF